MGTLTPKAVIELWNEMLNEGRKVGFGMKNSKAFIEQLDAKFEKEFKKWV